MKLGYAIVAIALTTSLGGCSVSPPGRAAASLTQAALSSPTDPASTVVLSNLDLSVSAAGVEKTRLEEAVASVDSLFGTTELWNDLGIVLAQYDSVFVGPTYQQTGLGTGYADSAGVVSLIRGTAPQTHRFSAIIGLTGTYYRKGQDYTGTCTNPSGARTCRATAFGQNYSNQLVVTHGIGLSLTTSRELVSIEIGREVFDRFNSTSVARRSCTYNTIAHEWTHTLGRDQPSHSTWVVDSDTSRPSGVPTLSYLFGSVVQCNWLQGRGAVGSQNADLLACVNRYGSDQFNSGQCV